MTKILNLLHFYQPPNQQEDILDRIVNECYRPLLVGFLARPRSKTVVNISGSLTMLLIEKGYRDVVDSFKTLAKNGQIEFTGSAVYHAFLPLLPKSEIRRQIEENTRINRKYFGSVYAPRGFFSPELAVNDRVFSVAKVLGFDWLCAAQVAYGVQPPKCDSLYKEATTGLTILFRNKPVSSLILSAAVRTARDLTKEARDILTASRYIVTVMDAETFGHHRIGHEKLIFEVLDSPDFETIGFEDLEKMNLPQEVVKVRASTWTNEEQDFWIDKESEKSQVPKTYRLWKDPNNPIHRLQWQLANLCIKTVNSPEYKKPDKMTYVSQANTAAIAATLHSWKKARKQLDIALASDQFWWASAKPWWSLEMIESGAFAMKEVLHTLRIKSGAGEQLYRKILDEAFEWQRNGYIRKAHLAASGTYKREPFEKRAPAEWYNQVILEFEYEMNRAAADQDFERAVKWRDAVVKIHLGTDIYDILHVVDELWLGRNVKWAQPQVKPFLEHDWGEFSDFAKRHFRDVSSEEDFERWKAR